jgi:hypothetical protein
MNVNRRVQGFRSENIGTIAGEINEYGERHGMTIYSAQHQSFITAAGREIHTALVIYECP